MVYLHFSYKQLQTVIMEKCIELRDKSMTIGNQEDIQKLGDYPDIDATDIIMFGKAHRPHLNICSLITKNLYDQLASIYFDQEDIDEKISILRCLISYHSLANFASVVTHLDIDLTIYDNILAKTAIARHSLDDYKYLVKEGLDVCANNNYALRNYKFIGSGVDFLTYLAEHGADLTVGNSCALTHAVRASNVDGVKYLINNNLDVNCSNGKPLKTAIATCVVYQALHTTSGEIVKLLLETGANVDNLDRTDYVTIGKTYNYNLIKLFIDFGADFTKLNCDNDVDINRGKVITDLLIGQGVDIDQIVGLAYKNGNMNRLGN